MFSPEIALFLGVAMLVVIMLRMTYRRLGRRRKAGTIDPPISHVAKPDTPWSRPGQTPAALLDSQEVELHELARDLTGRLDSKIVVLQQLIVLSDTKISELRQLLDDVEKTG